MATALKLVDSQPSAVTINSETVKGVTAASYSWSAEQSLVVADGTFHPQDGGATVCSPLAVTLTIKNTFDNASTPNSLTTLLAPGAAPGTVTTLHAGKAATTTSRTFTFANARFNEQSMGDDGARRQDMNVTFNATSNDGTTSPVAEAWA